jgi:hypothetical protein
LALPPPPLGLPPSGVIAGAPAEEASPPRSIVVLPALEEPALFAGEPPLPEAVPAVSRSVMPGSSSMQALANRPVMHSAPSR